MLDPGAFPNASQLRARQSPLLMGQASATRIGGCGQVLTPNRCARGWPTCIAARMAPYRGDAVSFQVIREHLCCSLAKRICRGAVSTRAFDAIAGICSLRMIIIRSSYDPTSATVGHAATAAPVMPWPQAVGDVRSERRNDAQA